MPRILHLIDGDSPQACPTTLALISDAQKRLDNVQQDVILLGGGLLDRAAQLAEVDVTQRFGVLRGKAMLGWLTLRKRLPRERLESYDLIHCWSVGAMSYASITARNTPRVVTFTTMPDAKTAHWLNNLCNETPRSHVLCTSSTIRRELIQNGLAEQFVHLLRPGLDFKRLRQTNRKEMRESWYVDHQKAKVFAMLSDPPAAADAMPLVLSAGLAIASRNEDYGQFYMLGHPRQHQRYRARELHAPIRRMDGVVADRRIEAPWLTLPACDYAIAFGENACGLSMLWAMAANIPIVAEATYPVCEILEDRHNALLVQPGAIKVVADKMCKLVDDQQLAWKLRDTAHHEAYSYFSCTRYSNSIRDVYDQVINEQPIDIPQPEITGGLRFAGSV